VGELVHLIRRGPIQTLLRFTFELCDPGDGVKDSLGNLRGVYSLHIGEYALVVATIRTSYYWPSLPENAVSLASATSAKSSLLYNAGPPPW